MSSTLTTLAELQNSAPTNVHENLHVVLIRCGAKIKRGEQCANRRSISESRSIWAMFEKLRQYTPNEAMASHELREIAEEWNCTTAGHKAQWNITLNMLKSNYVAFQERLVGQEQASQAVPI